MPARPLPGLLHQTVKKVVNHKRPADNERLEHKPFFCWCSASSSSPSFFLPPPYISPQPAPPLPLTAAAAAAAAAAVFLSA